MTVIEQIIEAVNELQFLNCKKEDLIIAYSPLVERYLKENLYEMQYPVYQDNDFGLAFLMGIKTYDKWPYNEIVIYDTKSVSYCPKLLIRIEIENATFGLPTKVFE